ncbi:predicted protein [Neisseria gonorrhoeae SK-92-679]|nr:predicted protein [Neisseria gonorrhoeae SK-92-679]
MARQKSRRVDHHRICQPYDCLYGQQVRIGNHSEKIRRANRCRLKPRVSGGIFTKAHQPEEKRRGGLEAAQRLAEIKNLIRQRHDEFPQKKSR